MYITNILNASKYLNLVTFLMNSSRVHASNLRSIISICFVGYKYDVSYSIDLTDYLTLISTILQNAGVF